MGPNQKILASDGKNGDQLGLSVSASGNLLQVEHLSVQ
jgi:hypothetical protein